jgi:hypothetical protein
MAGGLKKRRKRTIEGVAKIDGVGLRWELLSEPQHSNSGDGYIGLRISVQVVDGGRRELIIEDPFPRDSRGFRMFLPQRPPVTAKMVEVSIHQAIEEGWDPSSRGKAFMFHAPAAG